MFPFRICRDPILFEGLPALIVPPNHTVSIECNGHSINLYTDQGEPLIQANGLLVFRRCVLSAFKRFNGTAAGSASYLPLFGSDATAIVRYLHSFQQYPCVVCFILILDIDVVATKRSLRTRIDLRLA
jgi:hypothetical protein